MKWKAFKQLNQLYTEGETSNELLNVPLGKRILEMEYVIASTKKTISKTNHYDNFYSEKLQTKFKTYKELIEKYNLVDTNFEESELDALVKIEQSREQILDSNKSQKEISTLYFDSAKYLTKTSRLYNAVLSVLEITELPIDEHDQQYLKILHCKNKTPKAIILCENDNQIKKERLNDVELWYAGGRNTAKLQFIIEPKIPFYYLCDWDNRGIEIYQSIKRNYFPKIEIIVPQDPIKLLDKVREWKTEIDYSLFPDKAQILLKKLIPEKWIEEESIHHELLKR
ncbi:MAG: hypothetical protein HS118_09705 [Bacteroidia bacterium]|nr:hypothetical protein [Bacteroidia bacterium]